ncbi:MAG: iron-sulfur cluster assembly accessory protein [Chloroflexota bacterium]
MITVSDMASEKLKEVLVEEGEPGAALRIIIMPGPQGGAQYLLTLEQEVNGDDTVVHANGVRIVVDSESVPLLEGTEIDYVEGLMRSGFVINNPNFMAEGDGCACGGQCSCDGH